MSLTILNEEELQSLEQRAGNQLGDSALMERAGLAAAEYILERVGESGRVTILVGPGNNGGDALACACELRARHVDVCVVLPNGKRPTSALALAQLKRWTDNGGSFQLDPYMTRKADCVVDGLFGTGLKKPITGDYLDAVLWFNERQALKISLDIPSGLNAATGHWIGTYPGCRANVTIAFLCTKAGLYMSDGADASGEIVLRELDVSVPLSRLSVTGTDELTHILKPRDNNTHKGDYGRMAVIGGDTGMIGAPLLAARAGMLLGAGATRVECLSEKAPAVDVLYPELMFAAEPVNCNDYQAVVIGCGLGKSEKAKARVVQALNCTVPLVLDADALNIIADDIKLQDVLLARKAPTVITPHEGEAARLLRRDVKGVNVDRVEACRELAVQTGAIVVLKGPGTIISMRSSRTWLNATGNAMLATAGSGDVLAGMIGSFLAQGFDIVEAVLGAVYFHGKAAEGSYAGYLASDIAPNAAALIAEERETYLR